MQLYDTIQHAPLHFPASPPVSPELRDLVTRLLQKDPDSRITMPEIFRHPWVTLGDNLPLQSLQVRLAPCLVSHTLSSGVCAYLRLQPV